MADKDRFVQIFSKNIRSILKVMRGDVRYVQEVRLRVNAPLFVIYKNKEFAVDRGGELKTDHHFSYIVTKEDVEETLSCAAGYSLYAYEEELRQGYITVFGGHRIGITGRTVLNQTGVKTIQPVSSLNVRFAHQVKGCADGIMPYLYDKGTGQLCHTLLISPPCCGKTTMLRDLIRQISDGNDISAGKNVAVADERSEIGACFQGIPQNDVGIRTDILDGCPKAVGMMMLIRSMAPAVVAADEVGGKEDLRAIHCVMNCGCKILASVHGSCVADIRRKPMLKEFLEERIFDRYVVLSARKGPGTVEDICDKEGRSLICG